MHRTTRQVQGRVHRRRRWRGPPPRGRARARRAPRGRAQSRRAPSRLAQPTRQAQAGRASRIPGEACCHPSSEGAAGRARAACAPRGSTSASWRRSSRSSGPWTRLSIAPTAWACGYGACSSLSSYSLSPMLQSPACSSSAVDARCSRVEGMTLLLRKPTHPMPQPSRTAGASRDDHWRWPSDDEVRAQLLMADAETSAQPF
mmetsp:Transcript_1392/g.3935  ORF Transcript_1392/g.3935 Transcript_1392/m.3935 type:complete len:202 (-) Transcript_1392:279-884(-)